MHRTIFFSIRSTGVKLMPTKTFINIVNVHNECMRHRLWNMKKKTRAIKRANALLVQWTRDTQYWTRFMVIRYVPMISHALGFSLFLPQSPPYRSLPHLSPRLADLSQEREKERKWERERGAQQKMLLHIMRLKCTQPCNNYAVWLHIAWPFFQN